MWLSTILCINSQKADYDEITSPSNVFFDKELIKNIIYPLKFILDEENPIFDKKSCQLATKNDLLHKS